ncbi:uncharacterized protein LOC116258487 [Nymphaea colorata]|nr:uncharacterized protein LOC116258487 [Nymphaea colorata]
MLSMTKSLVQPEACDSSEHEVETFRPSKRANVIHDITNLSLNSNFTRSKRYKSEYDKPSENVGNLISKGLFEAKHNYSGNDEVACRAWDLHSQIYPGIKTKLRSKDIVGITLKGSDDREPSKSSASGNEDTRYIPQYFEGKKVVSLPIFLREQTDAATLNSQSSPQRERNLLDSDKENTPVFAEINRQPLSGGSRLSAINRVTSAAFAFPDISKGSVGISSASKISSGIQETFVKGSEEVHAANGDSCVESSDASAMRKAADVSGTILNESGFQEDMGCSSQVRSSWTEVSGHDRFHMDKSDTAQNCSCSFCCKAAYIWSDLNYHDVRGRLSVLKKSIGNVASLLGGNFFNDLARACHKQTYVCSTSQEPGKRTLESHLMHQWRSLFLQTEKSLSSEIMQLQSNLQKLKGLRENCKKDLEVIHNLCPNGLLEEPS